MGRGGGVVLLVPEGDAVALARGIEQIRSEAGLVQRLRDLGAARAAEFGWDSVAARIRQAYQVVLADRKVPG